MYPEQGARGEEHEVAEAMAAGAMAVAVTAVVQGVVVVAPAVKGVVREEVA